MPPRLIEKCFHRKDALRHWIIVSLFFICGGRLAAAESPANPRDTDEVDWPVYRGDKTAIQYSSLTQINVTNVHRLELAWEYHHGDPNGPSMYSNPLIIDGLLFFTTPKVNAVAL